jgi:hypothetical protein
MKCCIPILFIFSGILAVGSPAIQVRSLTVQVIDSETKEPIPGIVAYYGLKTVRPRHFLAFRVLDNPVFENVDHRKLITDARGMIVIEKRTFPRRWDEELDYERVLINLECDQRPAETWIGFGPDDPTFHHPNSMYCGADVFAPLRKLEPREKCWMTRKTIRYQEIWISESLRKDSERVVIELVRAKN